MLFLKQLSDESLAKGVHDRKVYELKLRNKTKFMECFNMRSKYKPGR